MYATNTEYQINDGIKALIAIYIKEQSEEALIKAFNAFGQSQNLSVKEFKHIAIDEFRQEIDSLATKDFVEARIAEVRTEITEVKSELKQEIAEVKNSMIKWVIGVGISATILSIGSTWALVVFLIENLKL